MLIPLHSVSVSLEGPQPAPVTSVPYSLQLHENELGSSVTALGSQHDADLQFWEVPSKKSRRLGTALGSRYPLDPGDQPSISRTRTGTRYSGQYAALSFRAIGTVSRCECRWAR
jgi:hypothetical protein